MTLGEILLALAVAAGALSLTRVPAPWRARATRVHVASTLAALGLLAADLVAGTLRYAYAWEHTRVDYPLFYRLAGVWGGEEGTILLWNAAVALCALIVSRRDDKLDRIAARFLLAASMTLGALGLVFGTFELTGAERLAKAPLGRGLADVLLTPLMVIHPPIQFVAYGLMTVPAAYALAALWSREIASGAWAGRAFPWARRAWLFATLGLGLGALWAYYVLSFGGYWAWDPVETSNLLPWLALTAFLHAGKQRMRGQGNTTASLVLAYLPFLLTLFATFATRSGLWVSVHAFTDPTDRFEPDAAARLLAILDAHAPTRAFLGLATAGLLAPTGIYLARKLDGVYAKVHASILLALAGAALLAPADAWAGAFALASALTPPSIGIGVLLALLVGLPFVLIYARDDEPQARLDLSVRTLMSAAIILVSIALAVTFLLELQVVNGPERRIFDQRAPFLALPIASVVTLMLALGPLGRRGALLLAGTGLSLGLAAAWLIPSARVVALAAPVSAAATLAAVLKLLHVQGASAPRRLRVAGALLLLSSLLAMLMWANPPTHVAGRALPTSSGLPLALAGIGLATLALLGAIATFRARSFPLSLAGALAGVLAMGYAIGALLAFASLALVASERSAFSRGFWAREGVRVRETGIYLIHLALVLGLLGYAASTYAQDRAVFTDVAPGSSVLVGDYDITLAAPMVVESGGKLDAVSVLLRLDDEGAPAGEEAVDFEWRESSGVYRGRLAVRRALAEDVYVSPMAFHTAEGWVGADSAAGARVEAGEVDAVSFSVSVLPLMSLVWGATWMMVLGMGLILVGSRRHPSAARHQADVQEP